MQFKLLTDSTCFKTSAQVLEQVLGTQGKALKAVDTAQRFTSATDVGEEAVALPPSSLPKIQQLAQQRRTQRFKTYEQVWELSHQGWSSGAIAQYVGVSIRTVQRYLLASSFPEPQGRSDRGISLLNPFKSYLLQQWNQGGWSAKNLFIEIQNQGYAGSYRTVTRYIRQLCSSQGIELKKSPTHQRLPKVVNQERLTLTARRVTWLVLQHPENLAPEDEQLIQQLAEQHSDLATAIALTQGFAQLVRQRQPENLDPWLNQAEQSHLSPFKRFAQSLYEDYDAVKAGVT